MVLCAVGSKIREAADAGCSGHILHKNMFGFDCLKQGFGGRVMLVGVNYNKDAKGENRKRLALPTFFYFNVLSEELYKNVQAHKNSYSNIFGKKSVLIDIFPIVVYNHENKIRK